MGATIYGKAFHHSSKSISFRRSERRKKRLIDLALAEGGYSFN